MTKINAPPQQVENVVPRIEELQVSWQRRACLTGLQIFRSRLRTEDDDQEIDETREKAETDRLQEECRLCPLCRSRLSRQWQEHPDQ